MVNTARIEAERQTISTNNSQDDEGKLLESLQAPATTKLRAKHDFQIYRDMKDANFHDVANLEHEISEQKVAPGIIYRQVKFGAQQGMIQRATYQGLH